MARNPLSEPEFAQAVGEAFASGSSRAEMAEIFGVTAQTITKWRRDPRVKTYALKLIEDRVLQVTRKVDGTIAQRLEDSETMTITELLAIRKEFLGGALRSQTEKADDETIHEAAQWLEANPERAAALEELLKDGPLPGVPA